VVALVKQPGAGKAGRGPADGRHRDPGIEKAPGGSGERLPAAGVPHLGTRQDEKIAVGGLQVGEQSVGHHPEATHRRDRLERLGDRDHVDARSREAPRSKLDEEVTDLRIGEPVVEGDMCCWLTHTPSFAQSHP
jgi:hypothetical protein